MRNDPFVFHNGRRAHNAEDLLVIIEEGPAELVEDHITGNRNDFATWAEHALNEPSLAQTLRGAKNRDAIIAALKKWVSPHQTRAAQEEMHSKEFLVGLGLGILIGFVIALFAWYLI